MNNNWCPIFVRIHEPYFLSILALRLMAVIIVTSYWYSRCCHPFVPLLVMPTYSSKTLHQHIVHVRRSSSFSVKLQNSLLQTYVIQIVLILTPCRLSNMTLCKIVFIRLQFETWPIRSSAWLMHGMDCRTVSLMMLTMNGRRDLGPAWRKKEDISNICCNNWTWTRLVVQLNLLRLRLCNNRHNVLSLHLTYFPR